MLPLLGRAAVLVALVACSVGAVAGFTGAIRKSPEAVRWSRWMGYVFAVATVAAVAIMEVALLIPDFSVSYVAEVGSTKVPTWVQVVSLWSSLNGSILLWAGMLGIYVGVFVWRTAGKHPEHTPWALGVLHLVSLFFAFLVAGVANPFAPMDIVPPDGPGPNPLLQNHILMVVHPPALYVGFVGMSVPFAIASAALFAGRLDAAWSRVLRRWTMVPWGGLTVGIILGGWWSYEVLGWGGWWAWDPVENASFMPWLTATAYLHSAMVMERKDQLKGWTLSLVLSTFLLTILGTFMTRSGVFNSVHSFTQSDIGPVFLSFLAGALVFSVVLLAARIDTLTRSDKSLAGPMSREVGFLVNNLLFVALTFTVLLGTVYPLIHQALTDEQLSVGEPYFDRWGAPLGLAIVFMMGVGPVLPWGRSDGSGASKRLLLPLGLGFATVAISAAMGARDGWALATFGAGAFAFVVTLQQVWAPISARAKAMKEGLGTAAAKVLVRTRRRTGGYIVHVGVICIAIAQAGAMAWSTKTSVTFQTGQTVEVGRYALTYTGASWEDQPHRKSLVANFVGADGGTDLGVLQPRLNHYKSMDQPIGTPIVHSGLDQDLYLNLVHVDEANGIAALEVGIKPLVWWLWFGGLLMLLGTIFSAWPSRTRRTVASESAKATQAPAAAAGK